MAVPSPDPSRWEKLGESSLTATRIFDLRTRRYRHPVRGTQRDFIVVDAPDWVNVIAITQDGHLVLVNQFRYGTDEFSLELPGGMIDPGEDPVVAGVRELREETGYAGSNARLLGSVHPNPAFISNQCHLVLVENSVKAGAVEWDHDEEIAVSTAPVDEVLQWGRSGKITHGLVLNAFWLFEPLWGEMRKQLKG